MSLLGASLRFLTNARPWDVAIVDAAGDHVTGFDSTRPASAALTSVAASAVSVTILASNAARRQAIVVNDGNKTLRLAFAATASLTAYTVALSSGNTYETPLNGYTGEITGIWDSANGSARVTEITA